MEGSISLGLGRLDRIGPGGALPSVALMEREALWTHVTEALERARAGRGSAVLVDAPSGLGKTAFLAAVGELGGETAMGVLTASGREREREFALGVVLQLLEGRVGRADDRERESLFSEGAAAARALFAEGPSQGVAEPGFSMLHGLYRLCANLSARVPLLLLVDDADLCDAPSLGFLIHLVERVQEVPIVVALSTGRVPKRQWPQPLKEIARHPATVRLRLEPLSAEGTRRRVRAWMPDALGAHCWSIHQASGGMPFLVDALAAELANTEGRDDLAPLPAPAQVAEWALDRARFVDERAPAFLSAAAALGSEPVQRHAAALSWLDDEDAAELVDGLVDSGLLALDGGLSFAQPVVAAALEAHRPPGQTATMHLRAARLLAAEAAPAEQAAAHLLRAAHSGSDFVVETLCGAAAEALRRGAPADAARYLRRALEEPPNPRMRARVLLDLGRAEATAGEPHAAGRLREAIESGVELRNGSRTALETGRALFALGEPAEAAAVFRRGLEQATDGEGELLPSLEAAHLTALWLTGHPDLNGMAQAEPSRQGDAAGARALLALQAIRGAFRGAPRDEVLDLAGHALGRGALLEDETADGLTYYMAAGALAVAEDLQAAEIALSAAREDAQTRGSLLGFATASHVRAVAILMRGRIGDAAADARDALAMESHGWRFGVSGARVVLANTHIEHGDLDAAERSLAEAESSPWKMDPFTVALLFTRGRLRLLRGDAQAALAHFLACRDPAERAGMLNPALAAWRSGAAHAMAMLGDTGEAEALAEEELALARAIGAPGPIGRTLRTLGAIRGNGGGLETLQAAVEVLEGSQAALERARSLVDFGAALRRSGRRRDAREPLRAGLDLARRCGAEVLVARAAREAKLAGARPRRTALHGVDSLTTRERQVATLAAEGLSNREIAETLVVTVKTVEWHLKHTYRKLGVGSRQDLGELLEPSDQS